MGPEAKAGQGLLGEDESGLRQDREEPGGGKDLGDEAVETEDRKEGTEEEVNRTIPMTEEVKQETIDTWDENRQDPKTNAPSFPPARAITEGPEAHTVSPKAKAGPVNDKTSGLFGYFQMCTVPSRKIKTK